MDGHAIYMHVHAKNNDFPIDFAFFYKSVTDRQTDRRTDRPMDKLSYRYAIAASKNPLLKKTVGLAACLFIHRWIFRLYALSVSSHIRKYQQNQFSHVFLHAAIPSLYAHM